MATTDAAAAATLRRRELHRAVDTYSPLQRERLQHRPPLPAVLQGRRCRIARGGEATTAAGDVDAIRASSRTSSASPASR